MEIDTPLTEVAQYLSADIAGLLIDETYEVQTRVLQTVRAYVIALEQHLVVDPITLQMYTGLVVMAELEEVRDGRPASGPSGSVLP